MPASPAGGPSAADHASLQVAVTYDAGASGSLGSMDISAGGALSVAAGEILGVGGDGNNTIEIHNSNAFSLGAGSQINYSGSNLHFRSGSVNSIDFANAPTGGKFSMSNITLVIGDDSTVTTLNLGAGSSGAQFGALTGGPDGLLNVNAATIGFDNWDDSNKLNATSGTVVNLSNYAAVYTTDAITLDNTSQLNVASHLYVRVETLNIAGASVTVDGDLFSDAFNPFQVNVAQNAAQLTGMTINGNLDLNTEGVLNLQFDNAVAGGALAGDPANFDWAFRWQGDHEAALQGLFATQLTVTGAAGFNAADHIYYSLDDDYTYVGFLQAQENAVPEPSTLVLAALGLAGLGLFARRKRLRRA